MLEDVIMAAAWIFVNELDKLLVYSIALRPTPHE